MGAAGPVDGQQGQQCRAGEYLAERCQQAAPRAAPGERAGGILKQLI
jgi:hypothetical protein